MCFEYIVNCKIMYIPMRKGKKKKKKEVKEVERFYRKCVEVVGGVGWCVQKPPSLAAEKSVLWVQFRVTMANQEGSRSRSRTRREWTKAFEHLHKGKTSHLYTKCRFLSLHHKRYQKFMLCEFALYNCQKLRVNRFNF